MINIMQAFFGIGGHRRNTGCDLGLLRTGPIAACTLALLGCVSGTAAAGGSRLTGSGAFPVAVRCDPDRDPYSTECPGHRPPGPPDRDVRPFEGTLGRPCAYRRRFTPSGTRRIRVCF